MKFKLHSSYKPAGDQPEAIKKLVSGYFKYSQQTLLGVTGSGKTFTMANIIEKIQKPTLIISHNKTLAAQLFNEFKEFFPKNKVGYFISYYDYYQPESYLPVTDTFIEKETQINEKIEEYRLETACSLVSRDDVIIVASVSCIYGLGNPQKFKQGAFSIKSGDIINKKDILYKLIDLQYQRNDTELRSGRFRVRGDSIEIVQGYGQYSYRISLFGDEVEEISKRELISNKKISSLNEITVFPANPFVIDKSGLQSVTASIRKELKQRTKELGSLEAHRLEQRTKYDLEMLAQLGYCKGVENYSRYFDKRSPGSPPKCLLDFFPNEFLMFIDESHVSLPQIGGMSKGDKARKKNLIDYGFRLPSSADNRPLKFIEFKKYMKHVIYVSATPAHYELQYSGQVVEQVIRPTYVVDPEIIIKKSDGQIDDLINELNNTIKKDNRALVTVLTKKMAENLTEYLSEHGIRVRYLHSEIVALERTEIIRDLRLAKFDVLVGINLLREGLDIPELGLVAIIDADKEGFLRNTRSLIQTIGRVARNVNSRVIMYADEMTDSIKRTIAETERRREKQLKFNKKYHKKPVQIKKDISKAMSLSPVRDKRIEEIFKKTKKIEILKIELETQMKKSAEELDFESAIKIRELLKELDS